jgi:hypothetical protein
MKRDITWLFPVARRAARIRYSACSSPPSQHPAQAREGDLDPLPVEGPDHPGRVEQVGRALMVTARADQVLEGVVGLLQVPVGERLEAGHGPGPQVAAGGLLEDLGGGPAHVDPRDRGELGVHPGDQADRWGLPGDLLVLGGGVPEPAPADDVLRAYMVDLGGEAAGLQQRADQHGLIAMRGVVGVFRQLSGSGRSQG